MCAYHFMNNKNLLNIYFFIVFLFTAQPCDIFNMTDAAKPLSILFMFGASLFMCLHFKIKLNSRPLIYSFIVMGIWGCLQTIVLKRTASPIIFIELFVTYVIFSLYKKDLLARFEHISVKMATLTLILWAICLIAYEPLYALAKAIGSPGANISQSLYIFSIPLNFESNRGFLLRNCGYSWEPGRFACMLIIALWFNIQRTGLKFKDKNFQILTLALISSQSTTGYLIYALMIACYYIAYKRWNPAYMIAGGCIFITSMSLPFMQNKIVELFQNSQNMEQQLRNMEYSIRHDTDTEESFYVPQRFDGFMFQSINFAHANKFIGEGRNFQNYYLNKEQGYPIVVSEGILNVFIRYGWIIGLSMYLALFRSSVSINGYYQGKGNILFPVLFIGLSFSYYLWAAPILMTLWLWSYWEGKLLTRKTIKQS